MPKLQIKPSLSAHRGQEDGRREDSEALHLPSEHEETLPGNGAGISICADICGVLNFPPFLCRNIFIGRHIGVRVYIYFLELILETLIFLGN